MMLIAKAPTRISFGGGGTDLPAFYERYGGLVVSTSIGYAFHTVLESAPSKDVQILPADHRAHYRDSTSEDLILDEYLQLAGAVTDFFKPRNGLVVFLASQAPRGCGLGICGALTVSMIKALSFWCGVDLEEAVAADIACRIQIDRLGMPVGRQDQYAAAFGGLNRIRFSSDGVVVEPLRLPPGTEDALEEGLMLFHTGVSQSPSDILSRLRQGILDNNGDVLDRLKTIKSLASEIGCALEEGDLIRFGELLDRSWMEKRRLIKGITTDFIDECYRAAREHGATGGKLSGAGGGGFLILFCPKERQDCVKEALEGLGLRRWPLTLDREGVQLMQAIPWRRLSSGSMSWGTVPRPKRVCLDG